MRDYPFTMAPGSLLRYLQAFYQRFFGELRFGFTTRVHYLNSCKKLRRGSKAAPWAVSGLLTLAAERPESGGKRAIRGVRRLNAASEL